MFINFNIKLYAPAKAGTEARDPLKVQGRSKLKEGIYLLRGLEIIMIKTLNKC